MVFADSSGKFPLFEDLQTVSTISRFFGHIALLYELASCPRSGYNNIFTPYSLLNNANLCID